MAQKKTAYLMENSEEALRLELKTDPEAVHIQAKWCGVQPGMHILDAGCGPGKVTSILYKMTQPTYFLAIRCASDCRMREVTMPFRSRPIPRTCSPRRRMTNPSSMVLSTLRGSPLSSLSKSPSLICQNPFVA